MPPLLLAAILTLVYAVAVAAFLRQRRTGLIHTRMGDVSRRKSPKHFAALEWFSFIAMPLLGLALLLLWIAAFARTFQLIDAS